MHVPLHRPRGRRWILAAASLPLLVASAPTAHAAKPAPLGLRSNGTVAVPWAHAAAGGEREIVALRTRTSRSYIAPGGAVEQRIAAHSINYRDASGRWLAIDSSLRTAGDSIVNGGNSFKLRL